MKRKGAAKGAYELEMRILSVLWVAGRDLSVQEIVDQWRGRPRPGYTTILKKLQVMETKGFVAHGKEGRAYRYAPLVTRDEVSRQKFASLLGSLFGGDRLEMVSAFLRETPLERGEIRRARALLDRIEEEQGHG